MADDGYKSFLKYICNEYINERLHRFKQHMMHSKFFYHWEDDWIRLKKAAYILHYINNYCADSDDIYSTFKIDKLERVIRDTRDGIGFNLKIAEDTGFLDAIDTYFDEIINGIDIKYFPESELDILKEFGSKDPKTDLEGILYLLKSRRKKYNLYPEKISVRKQLMIVEDILSEAIEKYEEKEAKHPPKTRRWFKGLGQIGQGAALSLGNMALVIGLLKIPVSVETQTWGALVSATTGVGMVLNGIGELRGE